MNRAATYLLIQPWCKASLWRKALVKARRPLPKHYQKLNRPNSGEMEIFFQTSKPKKNLPLAKKSHSQSLIDQPTDVSILKPRDEHRQKNIMSSNPRIAFKSQIISTIASFASNVNSMAAIYIERLRGS